jgi:ribosomal protein L40E
MRELTVEDVIKVYFVLFLCLMYDIAQAQPEDEVYLQYCNTCQGYKAPRAHHCRKCKLVSWLIIYVCLYKIQVCTNCRHQVATAPETFMLVLQMFLPLYCF